MGARPFLLRPSGKDYLWGGRRLKDEFVKEIDMTPLTETWECSTHPDKLSYVASGQFGGKSLWMRICKNTQNNLVDMPWRLDIFRLILVKFIDVQRDLSARVHSDDEYALANENDQFKKETWYILDVVKNAKLICGLNHTVKKDVLKARLSRLCANPTKLIKINI